MLSSQRSSASRLPIYVFWLVAIATQINFNHLSNMVIGSGWFVTLGLAVCCIYLFLAVRIPIRVALGVHGYLIVASLISYFVIGLSVFFLTGATWHLSGYRLPFRLCLSVVIIVASSFGAWVVLQRIGSERLLAGILSIQTVACILILLSSWLAEYLNIYRTMTVSYQALAESRFMGTFKGANSAGTMACYTVALALSLSTNGRYRVFAWGAAILGSGAAVLTFSRGAIVTLMLLYLFFLWSSVSINRLRLKSVTIWLFVPCVSGLFVLALFNENYLDLDLMQLTRLDWFLNLDQDQLDHRQFTWPLSISYIAESPIFGHGLSIFHKLVYAPPCHEEGASFEIPCGAHNSYLMLWGEAGIIPAVLFLIFTGSLFWIRLVLPKSVITDTIAGWGFVVAMAGMTADETPYYTWHNFIFGLSCAMAAHAFRESRRRKAERIPETRPVLTLDPGA